MKTIIALIVLAALTGCATPDHTNVDADTCKLSVLGKVSYSSHGELLRRYNCGAVVVYR